jgi:secondary thiamine-phosphate synthase enzyme
MDTITLQSTQRCELIDITPRIKESLARSGMTSGLGVVSLMHTTAGLTINNNLDQEVANDLLLALERTFPRDMPGFRHPAMDSDAHVKASLMGSSITLVVQEGELVLGHWQGVFLCEFDGPRLRKVKIAWMHLAQAGPPAG